jgi:PIN domain nuclease of toxin-antitoxin system
MRLLLDTHIFIGLVRDGIRRSEPRVFQSLTLPEAQLFLSVASVWEISIKTGLGKLDAGLPPDKIESYCEEADITVVPITAPHATASISPKPETKDPFDRLLLAQCKVEGFQLVTVDRALAAHPLALQT